MTPSAATDSHSGQAGRPGVSIRLWSSAFSAYPFWLYDATVPLTEISR